MTEAGWQHSAVGGEQHLAQMGARHYTETGDNTAVLLCMGVVLGPECSMPATLVTCCSSLLACAAAQGKVGRSCLLTGEKPLAL